MKELYSGNDNYSIEYSYEYKVIMMKTMWYLEYVIITYEHGNKSVHIKCIIHEGRHYKPVRAIQ